MIKYLWIVIAIIFYLILWSGVIKDIIESFKAFAESENEKKSTLDWIFGTYDYLDDSSQMFLIFHVIVIFGASLILFLMEFLPPAGGVG